MTMLKKVFASLLALVMLLTLSAAVAEGQFPAGGSGQGNLYYRSGRQLPADGITGTKTTTSWALTSTWPSEVAARLGVEFIAQPISWDAKELELASGTIDCIWNGMSITPEREESMAMTFPYLNNQIDLLHPAPMRASTALEDAGGQVRWRCRTGQLCRGAAQRRLCGSGRDLLAEVLGFDEYLTALMDLQQRRRATRCIMDLVVGDYRINWHGRRPT